MIIQTIVIYKQNNKKLIVFLLKPHINVLSILILYGNQIQQNN